MAITGHHLQFVVTGNRGPGSSGFERGDPGPSIKGTYRKVSHRWLQGYLNEFTWRYNLRYQRDPSMFAELVALSAPLASKTG
jgi:hypothetical protein